MNDNTGRPRGWTVATLGDVCRVLAGFGFPKHLQGQTAGSIPFYKVGDISEVWQRGRRFLSEAQHYVTDEVAKSLGARALPANTTVLAKIGAAIALNRRAMLSEPALVDNNVFGIVPDMRVLDENFLFYLTCTLRLGELARATTVPSLRKGDVESLAVPLPPLREQARIVLETDKQLTRLDNAVVTLERVQRNLKRYRASVLKAAVEGRLVPTEAELARAEGRHYEPAPVLLERILAERRRRWEEAELAKMKAKDKAPKDDRWKAKYKEPVAPDTSELRAPPEGWCWASVDQLERGDRRSAYGVLVPGPDIPSGVPLVRVGDIYSGRVDTTRLKRIDRKIADKFGRTYLQGGEVLLTLVGTIGRTAVAPSGLAGANVARAVGVIPVSELVNPHCVEFWFRSPAIHHRMIGKAHEVARKTLNLEDVRCAPVALAPRAEQDRIREAVENAESVVDAAGIAAEHSALRCGKLRQSILKWAFQGRLVDQDATDEPASVLLERIRAERTAAGDAAAGTAAGGRKPPRRRRTPRSKTS